jgi:hypothetical protein
LRFKKKGDRRSIHGRSPLFSPRALHRGETLTYVACLNASTSRWRNCTDVLSDPDVELGDAMSRIGARTELRRGNDIGARSYGSIASILKHGLDRACREGQPPEGPPIRHGNIRGRGYYH